MKTLFKVILFIIVGSAMVQFVFAHPMDSGADKKMDITIKLKNGKTLMLKYIGNFETVFKGADIILGNPREILVLDSNIYILNSKLCEILVYDADYKYLKTIGRKGAGPSEFSYPLSMTADVKGKRLFVSDSQLLRVQCFDPGGNLLSSFKTSPLIPDRIFYYDNRIFLSVLANMGTDHSLTIFDTGGKIHGKLFKLPENWHFMNLAIYGISGLVYKDFFIYAYHCIDNRIYRYDLKTGQNQILGRLNVNFKIPEIKFIDNKLVGFLKMAGDIEMIEECGLLLCSYGGGGDQELIKKHNWVNMIDVFSQNGEYMATCHLDGLEEDKAYGYKITVDEKKKIIYLLSPEACQIYVFRYSYK